MFLSVSKILVSSVLEQYDNDDEVNADDEYDNINDDDDDDAVVLSLGVTKLVTLNRIGFFLMILEFQTASYSAM